jgi:hypothetical protein
MEKFIEFIYHSTSEPEPHVLLGTIQVRTWQLISVVSSFVPSQSKMNIFLNNLRLSTHVIPEAIIDDPNYVHLIGAELNHLGDYIQFYKGFIYRF